MIPDDTKRLPALKVFFKLYIDLFGKYGDILATSDDLGAIAFVYYNERESSKALFYKDLGHTLLKGVDLLNYIKVSEICHMIKLLKTMSSDWIEDYVGESYIHFDLVAVKEEARGTGKAKCLLSYVIDEAQKQQKPLTLETQNPNNVTLYEHFGFETVHVITYEGIIQYCMVKK